MKTAPFALLALLLAGCAPAIGTHKALAPDAGPAAALTRIEPGRTIRLFLAGAQPIQAVFVSSQPDVITVGTNDRSVSLPISNLDSAFVRISRAGHGALIGGIIVGAVGAVFLGSFAAGMSDAASCDGVATGPAVAGGALGFLVGGGIGALVGTAASRWEPVYRARSRP